MLPRCARAVLTALVLVAGASAASAQEWHEAYRDGVKALAQGQPQRAVALLEYAAGQRPQPGRDVVTYGTNVERQYYPYVHLTEAYLQIKDLAGARSALARADKWAREPAEERHRLTGQVQELAARLASPAAAGAAPSAPAPSSAAVSNESAPSAAPAAPPAVAAASAPPVSALAAGGARAPAGSGRAASPGASSAPPPVAAAAGPAGAALEIGTQPPGASVYLDDELVGTTDPEWGRLVRTAVPPGRHRVRLALSGHQDVVEDVEVEAGRRSELRRRLVPSTPAASAASDHRALLFGTVAAVLLGLTAWALHRAPAPSPATPGAPSFDHSSPTPPRVTPPGLGSPGVHRAPDGFDYFGGYRLIAPLGRGGMATVFKVQRGQETCALKRPLPAFLEEPEFLERFLREAEIGRTLHHPNIVRILERGEVEGVPFFTMELVAGETLQAWLHRAGALEPRVAAGVVVQIAEALDYAHLKGIVHRDLKPSNVMILPGGTAKVMDYGIARARRFEGLTVTGAFLGSPEYVAPETIEGRGTDPRSDLYSLGVIFYETLTGGRPFVADTPFAILRKHLSEVPAPPSAKRASVPPELDRIVLRLLSKTPEERYAVAEELVTDLRDFLNRAA